MNETCKWHDEYGHWYSDCGMIFEFTVDGPTENGFVFCHKCGKRLEIETEEV